MAGTGNRVNCTPYHTSAVEAYDNAVAIKLWAEDSQSVVYIDRATAARLIRQLQRALDDSYNEMINERAGGSDDYR